MASTPKKPAPVMEPVAFEPVAFEPAAVQAAIESAPAQVEAAFEAAPAEAKASLEAAAAPVVEIHEAVRKAAEKGVTETRAAYARAKTAADEAASALESSVSHASKGVVAFNAKALDALRANADASFDFLKALISAKTVSEFVSLQSEHARKQTETLAAQAKELAALAQKIAVESSEPIKAQVAKSFKLSA